jgi:signal transduction histidine kinase
MIRAAKEAIKRRWPPLRLRTILFATLFFVAALPGISAVFLRVYENTLVRQTEAELVAQGAALAAAAAATWPGAPPLNAPLPDDLTPEPPRIDLNSTPILPERPEPAPAPRPPAPDAIAAARTLLPVLAQTRKTTLAGIVLLDRNETLATGPNAGGSLATLPEVRSALAGEPETVLRRNANYRATYRFEWLSRAAAIRVHHARPIVVDGKVVGVLLLSRSARALFKGLYEDRGKIAFGIVAILVVLIVLSGVLSRGIARPIEALGAATRSVASGRGRVPEPSPTAAIEIQGLYRDFAAMADAIERRSRYLRDFAHAMSHEFKTPLAGIRGAIELLEDHDATMSAEDRRRFLANADADARRLSSLVSRLLELARADMMRGDGGRTDDPARLLARIAEAAVTADFSVSIEGESLPPIAAAPATLDAVLTTLLDNSRQAGAMHATITASAAADRVRLRVADDGPGIPPADRERLFTPFFTSRRATGGTGLGLAIARSLLDAIGGAIALVPGDGGAAFEIDLPTADLTGHRPVD